MKVQRDQKIFYGAQLKNETMDMAHALDPIYIVKQESIVLVNVIMSDQY